MAEEVQPRQKKGAWSRSETNKGTGAAVYRWGLRRRHSCSLGLCPTAIPG